MSAAEPLSKVSSVERANESGVSKQTSKQAEYKPSTLLVYSIIISLTVDTGQEAPAENKFRESKFFGLKIT